MSSFYNAGTNLRNFPQIEGKKRVIKSITLLNKGNNRNPCLPFVGLKGVMKCKEKKSIPVLLAFWSPWLRAGHSPNICAGPVSYQGSDRQLT